MKTALLNPVIAERYSLRAFAARPITAGDVEAMFEAARWAPSSRNEQPWRYIYATTDDPEDFARLLSLLNETNAGWAKNAAMLVVVAAERTFRRNAAPNRHAWYDTGFATAALVFQALSLGIQAHPMGGFDADRARELLGIPEEFDPVVMLALGYPGDPESLPEPFREREHRRTDRFPLHDISFHGLWPTHELMDQRRMT